MSKKIPAENSIGNLLIQIAKRRRNKSNVLLSASGIHSGQDILLYYLSQEDGQTVSALAEKLNIQQGTISSMIERMEASEMIRKEKDAHDKRTSRIYLRPKGKKAMTEIANVWKTMETLTTKGLSDPDKKTLLELLKKIHENLS